MGPEILSAMLGRPGAVADLRTSDADVMGNVALLAFMMMMAVTPVHTMTGWKWHVVSPAVSTDSGWLQQPSQT